MQPKGGSPGPTKADTGTVGAAADRATRERQASSPKRRTQGGAGQPHGRSWSHRYCTEGRRGAQGKVQAAEVGDRSPKSNMNQREWPMGEPQRASPGHVTKWPQEANTQGRAREQSSQAPEVNRSRTYSANRKDVGSEYYNPKNR